MLESYRRQPKKRKMAMINSCRLDRRQPKCIQQEEEFLLRCLVQSRLRRLSNSSRCFSPPIQQLAQKKYCVDSETWQNDQSKHHHADPECEIAEAFEECSYSFEHIW